MMSRTKLIRPRILAAAAMLLSICTANPGFAAGGFEEPSTAGSERPFYMRYDESRATSQALPLASAPPAAQASAFRPRMIALLYYDTPVKVLERDMLVKFRAPGRRRAIATVEFVFF
jgi:hypothetical protein